MKPYLIGHRGARFEAPENTIAGFLYARNLGIDVFELDVHLTADGELAVIHDATVDRTTTGTGEIHTFTAAELAALDARSIHTEWPEVVGVPTLPELFAVFDGDRTVEWVVEIKRDAAERLDQLAPKLVACIAEFGLKDRTIVSSFERTAIERISRLDPTQRIAFIGKYDSRADLEIALELGCMQADIPIATSSQEIVQAAQAAGLNVVGWPGNEADTIARLLNWGVNAITTDAPSLARAYLDAI